MFDKNSFLSQRSLSIQKVLQKTKMQTAELVVDDSGRKFVLKTIHRKTKSTDIEKNFLAEVTGKKFEVLNMPQLIESGEGYLLMSFVEREHQTRESILDREWSESDEDNFVRALKEFQSIKIQRYWFSLKQRIIGLLYPVVKLMSIAPTGLKTGIISFKDMFKLMGIAFVYIVYRPTYRNVTTHYDLTTYNCAFSTSEKMSILDFELAYYLGDPLFDAAYFVTIPPARITEWTFQKKILTRFLDENGNTFSKRLRLRLILIVCSIVRCLYFKNDPDKRDIYSYNVKTLLRSNKGMQQLWCKNV